ncbi:MAG: isopentenyl-diphosphate Delta-isomerase [Proteobacteria bacterium]|nr:isopentenyl-diphosphate Delta-isomerase [Pseudomonadota bacterium]
MPQPATKNDIVSSESEELILVDSQDRQIGTLAKSACHDGAGVLHRAFSLFVFNPAGQLLIQQRAADKRLWPSFWANSCCSHPRAGEDMNQAIARRLNQELGMRAALEYRYKFEYQADYESFGAEHELCWVFSGKSTDEPLVNTTEIQAWKWIDPDDLTEQIESAPERFTPWLKLEWQTLNARHSME